MHMVTRLLSLIHRDVHRLQTRCPRYGLVGIKGAGVELVERPEQIFQGNQNARPRDIPELRHVPLSG